MGYARGRFGVEYQPRRTEGHPLLWVVVTVVLLVSCAFTLYRFTRPNNDSFKPQPAIDAPQRNEVPARASTRPSKTSDGAPSTKAASISTTTNRTEKQKIADSKPPKPVAPPPPDPNVERVQNWIGTSQDRPVNERVLLERLLAAEREKNATLAIDTIKKLHTRPAMADIQDALMRRLGNLNLQVLFSGQNNPLVTSVTARRGDSRDRIARENRTTPAAIVKLNPQTKWEKLKPGDAVRVLFVPSPLLVIYRRRGYADLSLKNGTFFNRYDISVKETAPNGTYPISSTSGETVWARFRELGITAQKRAEIEMFLSSGSRIIVAD